MPLKSSFTTDFFGLLGDAGFLSILWLALFLIFLFYSLNYRILHIRLTSQALTLRFSIFEWDVPVDGMHSCANDKNSIWRIGEAG